MSFDYSLNNNIEAAKSSINDGLVRFEHQDIEQDNSHLKAPPKYIEISWKTYRILGFIFFGLSIITPLCISTSPYFPSSQLPPLSPAKSIITLPGFIF